MIPIEYIALMIPFAGIALGAYGIWTGHKKEMMEKQIELESARAKSGVSTAAELEDRVQVLERIITDRGYDLSRQIENLRDEPKKLEEMN